MYFDVQNSERKLSSFEKENVITCQKLFQNFVIQIYLNYFNFLVIYGVHVHFQTSSAVGICTPRFI